MAFYPSSITNCPWKNVNIENLTKADINAHFISMLSTINSKRVYTIFIEDITIPSTSEGKLRKICDDDTIDFEKCNTKFLLNLLLNLVWTA